LAKTSTAEQADTTRKSIKPKLMSVAGKQKKETILNQATVTSVTPLTTVDLSLKSTLADSTLKGLLSDYDLKVDANVLGSLSTQLSHTIDSSVNIALDSSLHYITNLNANTNVNVNVKTKARLNHLVKLNPQSTLNARPLSRINAKTSGFTDQLFKAMERAGIDTKGKIFNFHISNQELTVNGKKQPDKVLKEILNDYLKNDKDTINFTYRRN
jgi:hypothetical protein